MSEKDGDYNLLYIDITLAESYDGLFYWAVTIQIKAAVYEKHLLGCNQSSVFRAVRSC